MARGGSIALLLVWVVACWSVSAIVSAGELSSLDSGSAPPAVEINHVALTLHVGDRLKISLFERLARDPKSRQLAPLLSNLVERTELSGEYVVQGDGKIHLPLIGGIELAGLNGEQLERAVASRLSGHFSGEVKVAIQLLEREPVYVAGAVPQAGTFKFSPGMTVLHALTLAGSSPMGGVEQWRRVELAREFERMGKSEDRLVRLSARLDVLAAEQHGRQPTASTRLVRLVGQERATELVEQAWRLLGLERKRIAEEAVAYQTLISATEKEMMVLQQKLNDAASGMKEKTERVQLLTATYARGNTTDANVHLARSEYNAARDQWNETRASIVRLEKNLAQLHREKQRSVLDARIEQEKEFKQTEESVAEEDVSRATVGHAILGLRSLYGGASQLQQDLVYEIVRRGSGGSTRIKASALAPLEPGDLLLVAPRREDAATNVGSTGSVLDPAPPTHAFRLR